MLSLSLTDVTRRLAYAGSILFQLPIAFKFNHFFCELLFRKAYRIPITSTHKPRRIANEI